MTDETIGLIAVIKGWGYPDLNTDERVAQYLRDARETKYRFTHYDVEREMKKAVVDYFSTCDNPMREIRRYFFDRSLLQIENPEWNVLRSFLEGIQVRKDGKFINGFRKISMFEKDWD